MKKDISNWNTVNIQDMSYMFSECHSLISLQEISKWNTNNVINFQGLFSKCNLLLLVCKKLLLTL